MVVWVAGQKRSRVAEFFSVADAFRFHYMRVVFGASYGMKP